MFISNHKIARARTIDEYVNLVQQAIDDTFDLKQAIEFDADEMSGAVNFVDQLDSQLKALYESMKDGSYQFATGDLPFVEIMEKQHAAMLPFKYLLKRINETHMKGLDIDADD